MNALVGDIGNTITKVCLIEIKTFKIKKIIYFDSSKISSSNYLKNELKKNCSHVLNDFWSYKGLDNICIHGCLPCKTKKEHMT